MAIVGQTVSSPYYNPGTKVNSSTGQAVAAPGPIQSSTYKGPAATANTYGSVLGAQAPQPSGNSHINPSTGQWDDNYFASLQQQPNIPSIDFDALIAPALQALDQQISPLEQSYGQQEANSNQRYDLQQQQNTQSLNANLGEVDTAEAKQNRIADDARNSARQQYSEVQQGIQSRYGGTTGTGAFATELAGRQTMQNMGAITKGVQESMGELTNKRIQIRDVGRLVEKEIENNRSDEINKIRSELQDRVAKIRSDKATLQMQKSQMFIQAQQWASDQINQINARNTAFKQQLFMQQQAADQQLQQQLARGKSVVDSISLQDLTQIQDQYPSLFAPGSGTKLTGKVDLGGGRLSTYDIGSPALTDDQKRQARIDGLINGNQ